MKNVFLDYLRRWRWVFVIVWFYAAGFSLAPDVRTQRMALMASVFCGPLLIAFDLRRGFMRVLSILPLPKRKLARMVWSMAVLLPVLVAVAGSMTGILLGVLFLKARALDVGAFAICTLAVMAWTGTAFLALTYLPMQAPTPGFMNQTKAALAGGAWGLSMGGCMLLSMWAPVDLSQASSGVRLFALGLLAATVFGFARAETIFPGQGSGFDSNSVPGTGAPPIPWRPASLTGAWFGFFTIVKASFLISLALIGGFALVQSFLTRGANNNFWTAFASTVTIGAKWGGLAGAMLAMAWMGSLRQLRVLPVSAGQIALAGCLCVWIPVICFSGIMASFTFVVQDKAAVLECLKAGLISGSVVNALVALFLRISSIQLRVMVFMGVFMTSQVGGVVFAPLGGPLLIASPFLVAAGWFLMRHNLLTRSEPYKTLPMYGMAQQVR